MRTGIRRVGIALVAAFLAVFLQLNYVQIFAAEEIANNPANIRSLISEYAIKRGDIVTADGQTVAVSRARKGRFKYRRLYPQGELFGHVTGYYSITYGKSRVESTYDSVLLGRGGVLTMQDIQDRIEGSGERGDDVVLTIDSRLQEAARQALGEQRGAVVALDPRNGAVRAMWSSPSYDPEPLASFDTRRARTYWRSLDPNSPNGPMVSTATSRRFPPGSTFKVITAAAALESGKFTVDSTFPDTDGFSPPQTEDVIENFSGGTCAGGGSIDLATAFTVSCNATFARLGLEVSSDMERITQALGFNEPLPFDVGTAASQFSRAGRNNLPRRALAGIGQGDVSVTPLQAALIAATVARGGEIPKPRLVDRVLDQSGRTVDEKEPETMGRAFSPDTAATLNSLMTSVVSSGTGTNAQIPGVSVAGKTGTAQTSEEAAPHAWFIAFAPAQDPVIAVAVLVENGGSFGAEATGGVVAAPIAREVMEVDRGLRGW